MTIQLKSRFICEIVFIIRINKMNFENIVQAQEGDL